MVEPVLMPEPLVCGLPQSFWQRLADARSRLLMLDYDGTLVPFHVDRMAARPTEELRECLRRLALAAHTRIVLVSGRPAEEVASLVNHLPITIVGAHGFERFEHMEGTRQNTLTSVETEGLAAAYAAARATGVAARVEEKPASVALHTRGLGPDEAREHEELTWNIWAPIAEQYHLECRPFSGGVEIRSRHYHKGIAVETLLAEMPEDVFAVYLGDDQTDEDAFRALAGRGAGIKVGSTVVETDAPFRLESPSAVQRFLEHWLKVAGEQKPRTARVTTRARLVVLSNRLPSFDSVMPAEPGRRNKPAGGLATAINAALKYTGGGMWVGWTGKTGRLNAVHQLKSLQRGDVTVLGMDLSEREVAAYYNGFCNHALWPILHSFQSHVGLSSWELEVYRDVNQSFAQALRPLLDEDDLVWVHDYHLIHVGDELRRLGYRGRVGFFLHVPFPSLDMLAILPEYKSFVEALTQYDLIGFHTQTYLDHYLYAVRRLLGARPEGNVLSLGARTQRAGVYPAGIDPELFAPTEGERAAPRARSLRRAMEKQHILIGVDRLDYTKGIPERMLSIERLIRIRPDLREKISMLQICAPSRTRVKEYIEQKKSMDALVGRLNAELGTHDWEPIRYLYRSYPQSELAGFYREADAGLVTPLRDGMNLVAKEFIAAQRPNAPGVLVLSRFAGAAEELTEAVSINPYLPESCARGIIEALEMPQGEKIERHRAMLQKVQRQTAQKWAIDFLEDLRARDPGLDEASS